MLLSALCSERGRGRGRERRTPTQRVRVPASMDEHNIGNERDAGMSHRRRASPSGHDCHACLTLFVTHPVIPRVSTGLGTPTSCGAAAWSARSGRTSVGQRSTTGLASSATSTPPSVRTPTFSLRTCSFGVHRQQDASHPSSGNALGQRRRLKPHDRPALDSYGHSVANPIVAVQTNDSAQASSTESRTLATSVDSTENGATSKSIAAQVDAPVDGKSIPNKVDGFDSKDSSANNSDSGSGNEAGDSGFRVGMPHTKETRQKISMANKGRVPWNKGKKHSEETRRKIAMSTRRAMKNGRTRQLMKEASVGRRHTKATRMKIASSCARTYARKVANIGPVEPELPLSELVERINIRSNARSNRRKHVVPFDYSSNAVSDLSQVIHERMISYTSGEKASDADGQGMPAEFVRPKRVMPESTKAKLSKRIKELWSDKEYREKVAEGVAKRQLSNSGTRNSLSEEHKERIRQTLLKRYAKRRAESGESGDSRSSSRAARSRKKAQVEKAVILTEQQRKDMAVQAERQRRRKEEQAKKRMLEAQRIAEIEKERSRWLLESLAAAGQLPSLSGDGAVVGPSGALPRRTNGEESYDDGALGAEYSEDNLEEVLFRDPFSVDDEFEPQAVTPVEPSDETDRPVLAFSSNSRPFAELVNVSELDGSQTAGQANGGAGDANVASDWLPLDYDIYNPPQLPEIDDDALLDMVQHNGGSDTAQDGETLGIQPTSTAMSGEMAAQKGPDLSAHAYHGAEGTIVGPGDASQAELGANETGDPENHSARDTAHGFVEGVGAVEQSNGLFPKAASLDGRRSVGAENDASELAIESIVSSSYDTFISRPAKGTIGDDVADEPSQLGDIENNDEYFDDNLEFADDDDEDALVASTLGTESTPDGAVRRIRSYGAVDSPGPLLSDARDDADADTDADALTRVAVSDFPISPADMNVASLDADALAEELDSVRLDPAADDTPRELTLGKRRSGVTGSSDDTKRATTYMNGEAM